MTAHHPGNSQGLTEHVTEEQEISTEKMRWRLLASCFYLFAVGYVLQMFSPLRINTDSYRLLSMSVSAYRGEGYLVDGHVDQFPTGYPFVVKLLLQAGLANSMTLVIFNLVCLFVALSVLYICWKTECGPTQAILAMTFTIASWIMVKHVTLALTDIPYFCVSSLSLFCAWTYYRENGPRKWWWFAASTCLGYVALQCRSVGLAIFPALLSTGLWHRDHAPFVVRLLTKKWQLFFWTVGLTLLVAFVIVASIRDTGWFESQFTKPGSYFRSLLNRLQQTNPVVVVFRNVSLRVLEFGELFGNVPGSKALRLPPIMLHLLGLAVWVIVLRGAQLMIRRRCLLPFVLYFFFYTALMVTWPYYDPRFWLPLLPVLAVLFFAAVEDLAQRWPVVRPFCVVYLTLFLLPGLAAILFSTRISLAGAQFSELYGDGGTTMTYRYAFGNRKDVNMGQVDFGYVRLLRIFEPLAAHPANKEGQPPPTNEPRP
jgi:hypothetical protein